ncbi:hypothetical protein GCM10011494_37750 [Novosphingobium endophyticum]|uniref:Uncharacterized protein n=1 Tax=Novosphingobium endophyticum TaxID=1955250 RepID=A0A916X6D0_9SPHN|nr:hypothetical protein [Novosphingobium endophyticum]GGC15352.1 hypothetical protein GCM10011494_37750 [Novosphingobium endophyticum]
MAQERFAEARAKITRSLVHYEGLRSAIESYEKHHGASVEKIVEGEQNLYRVRISPEPTTGISLIIGDFVHNLRSALDYATCALMAVTDPQLPQSRIQFPFGRGGQILNHQERKNLGCSRAAIGVLEGARRLGGPALILLNLMSNQDKHRLLVASVIRQQKAEIQIDFSKSIANIIASPALDTHMWNRSLQDGDVLAIDTDANPGVGLMFSFVFGLTLDGRDDAIPVNDLHEIGRIAEKVVQHLDAAASRLGGSA